MKTTSLIIACVSILFLSFVESDSFKSINRTLETVKAVFDGHEDYGYNFIVTNEEDEEHTMTFQVVEDSVLKQFDLHSESLIGKKFEVGYTSKTTTTKDEDGFDNEIETLTVTSLIAL